jgi:two-component system, response regulator YesN
MFGFQRSRRSMYFRILLSVLLLGVLLVVLLSTAIGMSYERYLAGILAENDERTLEQISYSSNVLDTSARTFTTALFNGNLAQPLMYESDISIWEAVKLIDAIRIHVQSSSSIHSVYVYNREIDRFYSTMYTSVQSAEIFFDTDLASQLANGLSMNRLKPIPRIMPGRPEPNVDNTANVFTYVLPDTLPKDDELPTCVIVNVNAEYLMETARILTPGVADEEGVLFVSDANGRIVGHPSKHMFLRSDSPFELKIIDANLTDGFDRIRVDNVEYLVSTITSKQTGWRFYKATPYRTIIRPILRQRSFMIAIGTMFLFIGVTLAVLLSRTIYRPIRSLVKEIRWLASGEERGTLKTDELQFVSTAFSNAIQQVRELNSFRSQNIETVKLELIRELLSGSRKSEDEMRTKLREFGSSIHDMAHFRLVLVQADAPDKPRTPERTSAEPLSYTFSKMTSIVASRYTSAETVSLATETTLVIAGARHPISIVEMKLLHGAINDAFQHVFGFTVTTAIGAPCFRFDQFAPRYRSIVDIIRYRLVRGPGTCFDNEEPAHKLSDNSPFPVEHEKALLEALKSGNERACQNHFANISRVVSHYSYDNILLGFTRAASLVFDGINEIRNFRFDDESFRFTVFMDRLGACKYLVEIEQLFISLIRSICTVVENGTSGKVSANVSLVKRMLVADYSDPNLNQQIIASKMGMSPAYLGRIFKESEGVSISGYLNHLRLEKAKELLSKDRVSAEAISRSVGFTSTRYFFTKFKAEYGITPTQYRTGPYATESRQ